MRLFCYYAFHTFVNQVRKLLKTWMLIFILACMLIGGVIGFGASRLSDMAEDQQEEETVEEETEAAEERRNYLASRGLDTGDMIELIAGAVILAVFVFEAMSADKNGSKIFLPADVNLLFPSPMKPQSVLMFRLMTQLGTAIIASIYMLFQLPNLVLNLGLSIWAALGLIAGWCFTIMLGKLLQLLLYTLSSAYPWLKRNLRRIVYLLLFLIALGYFLTWKRSGEGWLEAAVGFLNGRFSRYVPLWGWVKGFCMYIIEKNAAGMIWSFAAVAAAIALLVYFIWREKADFYEDAMAKSEETAELMERAQSENSNGIVRRKKDRSEKLRRDGLHYGWGANVYFFKTLYNRFRFAHLGFFTKTTETYLAAAALTALLCRFVFNMDNAVPVALVLAGLSFFRSLGNPLAQDTGMSYFILIPESTWAKLFFSLLGGTANCLLDVLPALLLGSAILWVNPLPVLAWLPFVLTLDFYATSVGAFINLSVPVSAGKTVKQIVQIMFIYFGLLPDVAILAVGMVMGRTVSAALLAALLNLILGLVFFALTPLFLDPRGGKRVDEYRFTGDLKETKQRFSRLGLGVFAILLTTTALQLLLSALVRSRFPAWAESDLAMWLITFAPLYLVGVPLGLLILRTVPASPPEQHRLSFGRWLALVPICVFLMYAGNLLGVLFSTLLRAVFRVSAGNPLLTYATSDSLLLKTLVIAVLAPLIEEIIFRKQLIDRMSPYGGRLAVVTSAVVFALFHANFSQLFYAFGLGLLFGYVYWKTGRLRYSVALHMLLNFLGSVLAPALLERSGAALESGGELDLTALSAQQMSGLGFLGAYILLMLGLALLGLVLLCIKARDVRFVPTELTPSRGSRFQTVYMNAGMLLFLLGCLGIIVRSLFI